MSSEKIYAVITGDVIKSSAINRNYQEVLHDIADEIKGYYERFLFELFRGDSLQTLVKQPGNALLIGIIIRAGLRRYSRS